MNELQFQKLIVDSVRLSSGVAYKASHKFLNSIPDLVVQIPGLSTVLWEVKIRNQPAKTRVSDYLGGRGIKCELTKLQYKFLSEFSKAGGQCGVILGVRGNDNLMTRASLLQNVSSYPAMQHWLELKGLVELKRGSRSACIVEELKRATNERR